MTTQVESAWPSHPGYRIEITPCRHRGQVWLDDILVAESQNCLLVSETDHVDRLYFPESAVNWDLFTATDHTTVCPFKGRASYWSLTGTDPVIPNVIWSYPTPLPEVAGIAGHVSFYDTALRVVVVEDWPDSPDVPAKFPLWGDADELLRLIDVEQADDHGLWALPRPHPPRCRGRWSTARRSDRGHVENDSGATSHIGLDDFHEDRLIRRAGRR